MAVVCYGARLAIYGRYAFTICKFILQAKLNCVRFLSERYRRADFKLVTLIIEPISSSICEHPPSLGFAEMDNGRRLYCGHIIKQEEKIVSRLICYHIYNERNLTFIHQKKMKS